MHSWEWLLWKAKRKASKTERDRAEKTMPGGPWGPGQSRKIVGQ